MYKVTIRYAYDQMVLTYFYEKPSSDDINAFWNEYDWHSGTHMRFWEVEHV